MVKCNLNIDQLFDSVAKECGIKTIVRTTRDFIEAQCGLLIKEECPVLLIELTRVPVTALNYGQLSESFDIYIFTLEMEKDRLILDGDLRQLMVDYTLKLNSLREKIRKYGVNITYTNMIEGQNAISRWALDRMNYGVSATMTINYDKRRQYTRCS